jgi:hypothetical protein
MTSNRDRILGLLERNLESLNDRIQRAPDDLDPDEETLQLKRQRTLAQLASQYRLLAKDMDLDEMEGKLELLEKTTDRRDDLDD